ncbi:hypothetical protein B0H14DRAFT_3501080 [Mycena olivaceomarginata]|nr:hypothetical protein B0H14DRAFT_3501080 [Mycena olivaceomarginata]
MATVGFLGLGHRYIHRARGCPQKWGGDDEDDISPYGGETFFTTHYASMVTLVTGLGGRAGRGEISLSGAEYDPPLNNTTAAVDPKLSMLDMDSSQSRYGWDFIVFPGRLDGVLQCNPATSHRLPIPAQSASAPPTPLPPPPPPPPPRPTPTARVPASLTPSNASPSPQNGPAAPTRRTTPTTAKPKPPLPVEPSH